MTFRITNIGVIANDGTGDTLRGAFANTNNNFAELFDTTDAIYMRVNATSIVANGGYRHSNVTMNLANQIYDVSNAAFIKANSLSDIAILSLNQSNTTYFIANQIYDIANITYGIAGAASVEANLAYDTAVLAYDAANAAVSASAVYASDLANLSYVKANSAYNEANLAYAAANNVTDAYNTANLAFAKANTAYNTATLAFDTANNKPYDIGGFVTGTTLASERIFQFNVVRNFTIAANCVGSTSNSLNAAGNTTIFTINKNITNVGTMIYSSGANSAVFNTSGNILYMNVGDHISITAPTTPDTILSDFSYTFKGVLV